MEQLTEIRVRTKIPESEMEQKVGKILAESDYNVRLTGPARVLEMLIRWGILPIAGQLHGLGIMQRNFPACFHYLWM